MTDHLVEYLRSVLDASAGQRRFQILSDEEVAAMDGATDSEFGVLPWIDSLEGVDRSMAAKFGERSLFLRGLLQPRLDEPEGLASLVPSDELRLAADARRNGAGFVLMRSTCDGVRTARYLALQAEAGAFEEDIDVDGMHVYSACTYEVAIRRLAEYALPDVHHNGAEVRTRIPVTHWRRWLINELGVDHRPVQVNTVFPGPTGELRPAEWLVAHSGEIGLVATRDGDALRIASITQARLEHRLAEEISARLNPGSEATVGHRDPVDRQNSSPL